MWFIRDHWAAVHSADQVELYENEGFRLVRCLPVVQFFLTLRGIVKVQLCLQGCVHLQTGISRSSNFGDPIGQNSYKQSRIGTPAKRGSSLQRLCAPWYRCSTPEDENAAAVCPSASRTVVSCASAGPETAGGSEGSGTGCTARHASAA